MTLPALRISSSRRSNSRCADEHLWSRATVFLNHDALPEQRVVVRFEFEYAGEPETAWLPLENGGGELCASAPGHGEDLVVEIRDTMVLARWHLGHIEWGTALRSGIVVHGPTDLRRALPTWNLRPQTERKIEENKSSPQQVADFIYDLNPGYGTS